MRRFLPAAFIALGLGLGLGLSGCGKPGRPLTPPGSTYPQIYPDPKLAPPSAQKSGEPAKAQSWDQQDNDAVQAAQTDGQKHFTAQGSYVDPAVQDLLRSQAGLIAPGSLLPTAVPAGGYTNYQPGGPPISAQPTAPDPTGQGGN